MQIQVAPGKAPTVKQMKALVAAKGFEINSLSNINRPRLVSDLLDILQPVAQGDLAAPSPEPAPAPASELASSAALDVHPPAPAPLSPVSVAPAPAPAPVSPVSVAPPLAPAPNIAAPQRRRRLPRNVAVVASYNDEQPAAVDREIELMINRVDV